LFILLNGVVFAQVHFQSLSFDEAIKDATAQGKLIFIQFESVACTQCNEVANKSFENKELGQRLDEGFICLKIGKDHQDRKKISDLYQVSGFGSLFLSPDKSLLHKYSKSTTLAREYQNQVDIALQKAGENLTVKYLQQQYDQGNRATGFLELLIEKRRSLGLATDSLLDEYVRLLPSDSSHSFQTLQFIARSAPALNSTANSFLRKDLPFFSKAWYQLPLAERVSINSRIIYKTLSKAIAEKNELLARQAAQFSQSVHSTLQEGTKAYAFSLLRYYEGIRDTANYLPNAVAYYNRYFMNLNIDSIKKIDSINLRKLLDKSVTKDSVINGTTLKKTKSVTFRPSVQYFANELSNAAENFYHFTNDPARLAVATQWMKRSLDFFESYETLGTYALLLYKQHQTTAAIEALSRSVVLRKKIGFPINDQEVLLEKMKKGLAVE
jgi:hypothetical protein